MSDTVIAVLITGGINVAITLVSAVAQSKNVLQQIKAESEMSDQKLEAKLEKHQAVTNEKIEELSRRVEKHNSVIERTYRLENEAARHDEQIKTLFTLQKQGAQHA